jgi:glycine cleavage system H protein
MPVNRRRYMSKEPEKESASLTRREFLKEAGLAVGGIAISSIALQSACSSSNKTVESTKVQPTSVAPTSVVPTTPSTGYKYIPSNTPIPLLEIENSCSKVATDRLYSEDHCWVKSVADDIVAMGISDTFSAMLYKPNALSLVSVGTTITKEECFGTIEGSKLNADLLSPVSGTVIDVNTLLLEESTLKDVFAPTVGDSYGKGWMIAVRISNPAELKDLLTPEQYFNLVVEIGVI